MWHDIWMQNNLWGLKTHIAVSFPQYCQYKQGSRILSTVLKIKEILWKFDLVSPWRRSQRSKVTSYLGSPHIIISLYAYMSYLYVQTMAVRKTK